MSNYNSLKTIIDANIKQNGNQEITGQILNSVLNQMVTTLGAEYQFAGVATIDTNPGTTDAKVFYIANGKGTYTNFGSLEVTEDEVVVLYYDTEWHKVATGIASQEKLTELTGDIVNIQSAVATINSILNENILYSIVGGVDDTGQIRSDLTGAKRTDYIVAVPGIIIKGYDGAGSYSLYNLISFFDENKNFISQYPFDTAGYKTVELSNENIPTNAFYFIAATLASSAERDTVTYILPKRNEEVINTLINDVVNILPEAKEYTDSSVSVVNEKINETKTLIDGVLKKEIKTSISASIQILLVDTPTQEAYKLKVDCPNPPAINFNLYKCNTKSDLEIIGSYEIGQEIPITRDANKPNLYIYYKEGSGLVPEKTYTISFIANQYVNLDIANIGLRMAQTTRWDGKNMVCFGDSITEFGDQFGKRYSDYIEEITGVYAINVGIGGTQYRQRQDPAPRFNAETEYLINDVVSYNNNGVVTYNKFIANHQGAWNINDVEVLTGATALNYGYAALDVVNMVKSAYENDYTKQIDAAIYIRDNADDDNTAVVGRLQNINWSNVDLVTFAAGTNDWNNAGGNNWGESGSVDINKTLGAFNMCIQMILEKNPNIKIYVLTPIVRWLADTIAERTNENWSDNFKKSGTTLKQFAAMIYNEATLNHIPVADMYNTLGINQKNFTYYFGEGGTHPIRYEIMGRKIVSFINANRTF